MKYKNSKSTVYQNQFYNYSAPHLYKHFRSNWLVKCWHFQPCKWHISGDIFGICRFENGFIEKMVIQPSVNLYMCALWFSKYQQKFVRCIFETSTNLMLIKLIYLVKKEIEKRTDRQRKREKRRYREREKKPNVLITLNVKIYEYEVLTGQMYEYSCEKCLFAFAVTT